GGELSFQGGGYAQTDIEQILPVRLGVVSKGFKNESFNLQLDRNFLRHPILQLEKESGTNRKVWKNLPQLNGINVGLEPHRSASVLASFISDKTKYPVLVAGPVGKGKSLIVATDSLWNWNFRHIGEGGSGRYYHRFWNNLISWLINEPETRLMKLETHKERYEEEEEVLLRISVLKSNYDPYVGAKIRLTIETRSGDLELKTIQTDDDGEASYHFTPKEEGYYTVKAEVGSGKSKLEEKTSFSVFSETAEFQKPRVNETLLRQIAEVSGGSYEALSRETDLSQVRFKNPKVEIKSNSKYISLWDNWWVFGLLLSLLFLEWFSRRKSGLT
ncbi:uncharacterized protein METZ01_LOCUS310178, partial [marine metagenome]